MITYDIPQRWQTLKLRQILRPYSEKNHPELPLLSVVREKGVIVRNTESKEENHNYIPEDLSGYKRVKAGQFAMNKMKAWQGSYGISKYEGIVSPAYFVFDVIAGMNLDFFNLAIRSKVYVSFFGRASDGIRVGQWDLSIDRMKEIPFFVPPREEQDQIVRFLDWKVSEINRLINIKRKEIERLEELKKAVVSQAVTYGIDGSEYPHIPLKRAFHILDNCRMPIAADMRSQNSEVLYDYYGASGAIDKIDGYTIDDDVLLIGEDGANLRLRNLPLIYQVHGKAWINNHAHILKPMDFMDYYYSFYMLETLDISIFITGAAQPKLTQEALRNLQIIAPSIEEQRKISAYLDVKCGKINTIIENKQSQIKALQEFKTRLISDTVTGKIDVRGIEIPEYEYTAEESDIDEKPDLTDGEQEYD